MSGRHVLIFVSQSRITAMVLRGRKVVASEEFSLAAGPQAAEWRAGVSRAGRLLKPFVETNKLGGVAAMVLFRSPTELTDVVSIPVRSLSRARRAAELTCLDSINYPSDLAVTAACPLGQDRSKEARTHVLTLADRDDALSALASMVEDAGLKFVGCMPRGSAILARVIRAVLRKRSALSIRLHIERQGAIFVATERGRLLFARQIGFGVDTMIQSLMRPIRTGTDEEQITLDSDTAQRVLATHGIPEPREEIQLNPPLVGRQILPLLEPHLQRLVVEMKQSLRFGLDDDQRQVARVQLTGSGATIRRLAPILSRGLGIEVDTAENVSSEEAFGLSREAIDASRSWKRLRTLVLRPSEIVERMRMARLKSWLWTGAATAGLVMALETFQLEQQLRDLRSTADSVERHAAELEQLESTNTRVRGLMGSLNALANRIDELLPPFVDHEALLREFSRTSVDGVRLTDLEIDQSAKSCRVVLYGFVGESTGSPGLGPAAFVEELRQSPLIADVHLGTVRYGMADGNEVQFFELTVTPYAFKRHQFLVVSPETSGGPNP